MMRDERGTVGIPKSLVLVLVIGIGLYVGWIYFFQQGAVGAKPPSVGGEPTIETQFDLKLTIPGEANMQDWSVSIDTNSIDYRESSTMFFWGDHTYRGQLRAEIIVNNQVVDEWAKDVEVIQEGWDVTDDTETYSTSWLEIGKKGEVGQFTIKVSLISEDGQTVNTDTYTTSPGL